MKYLVTIPAYGYTTVEVEADSEEEAIEKASSFDPTIIAEEVTEWEEDTEFWSVQKSNCSPYLPPKHDRDE